ncbi:hypothetical protein [Paraburkholderia sp. Cpub6]|uniref:hypothetical protein n=1 Tax=Paraburkholderia sp. Cpub6 TaxID=2723094 RepID=UPI001621E86D|nr:hypothetical protein [Paraburkholderia sp. Cpub6]MBB5461456.1 hypothetical protein [Paraburkholderia sp. Cpub6]
MGRKEGLFLAISGRFWFLAFFLSLFWLCWPFLADLSVYWRCPLQGGAFFVVLALLAFPCCLVGLLALPLCGAAPTFFAAAKKVGKEDSSNRQLLSGSLGLHEVVVHLESVLPHIPRQ